MKSGLVRTRNKIVNFINIIIFWKPPKQNGFILLFPVCLVKTNVTM